MKTLAWSRLVWPALVIVSPAIVTSVLLLVLFTPLMSRLLAMAVSRRREYQADATAVELTRNSEGLARALEKIEVCRVCGNMDTQNPCAVCSDARRDPGIIVVVADVADLWALERAHAVNARYHVLGGTLSPLDGIGPQDLAIDALVARAHDPAVTEVILALNATVEGQSTAHYLSEQLEGTGVTVSRLAQGVPVGGELDYLDEGTLAAAIKARRRL